MVNSRYWGALSMPPSVRHRKTHKPRRRAPCCHPTRRDTRTCHKRLCRFRSSGTWGLDMTNASIASRIMAIWPFQAGAGRKHLRNGRQALPCRACDHPPQTERLPSTRLVRFRCLGSMDCPDNPLLCPPGALFLREPALSPLRQRHSRGKARALASRIALGNRLTGAPRRRNDQNKSKHG